MNSVQLIGYLTNNVEYTTLQSGMELAKFNLAINNKYKKNGEIIQDVCFIEVECWGKNAQLAKDYLKKGARIAVNGSLKLQSWKDANTGQMRYKHSVTLQKMHFLEKKEDKQAQAKPIPSKTKQPLEVIYPQEVVFMDTDDEIPF